MWAGVGLCRTLVKQHHLDRWVGGSDWVIHDLRRTVASNMARLGVRIEVADKVLNHVSGKLGGVAGVYQKYEFAPREGGGAGQTSELCFTSTSQMGSSYPSPALEAGAPPLR